MRFRGLAFVDVVGTWGSLGFLGGHDGSPMGRSCQCKSLVLVAACEFLGVLGCEREINLIWVLRSDRGRGGKEKKMI